MEPDPIILNDDEDVDDDYGHRPPTTSTHETRCGLTKIYHPNIDKLGGICLDILKDKWSPALQIRTVLLSIQALLSAPNLVDPLSENIAKHWKSNEAEAVETGGDTSSALNTFEPLLISKNCNANQEEVIIRRLEMADIPSHCDVEKKLVKSSVFHAIDIHEYNIHAFMNLASNDIVLFIWDVRLWGLDQPQTVNLLVLAVVTFVSIPMIFIAIQLQWYYFSSAKELVRINGTTKSFIANHLSESLVGAMSL
ncbi:hypothetical protein OROGR_023380 [Orobanche gracilis]